MNDYQIAFAILSTGAAVVFGVSRLLWHWDEVVDFVTEYIRPHPWYAIGVLAYFVLFLLLGLF